MEARIKLSDATRKQKSCERTIIEWMQQHPFNCKNTSAPHMARAMVEGSGYTLSTIRQTIPKMVNKNLLYRRGTIHRGNYFINYLHSDIVNIEEIQRNRTEEDTKFVEATMAKLNEYKQQGKEAHLDDEGAVTTKLETSAEKAVVKPVATKFVPHRTKPEGKRIPVVCHTDAKEESQVVTPVTITKDGNGINLSINLTINLN